MAHLGQSSKTNQVEAHIAQQTLGPSIWWILLSSSAFYLLWYLKLINLCLKIWTKSTTTTQDVQEVNLYDRGDNVRCYAIQTREHLVKSYSLNF